MDRRYAPVVDIVRCAAASMVALYHLGCQWPHADRPLLKELGYPAVQGGDSFLYFGFIGVEIFFVISGFVIASSCIGRSPRQFLIGRAIRLVPILWLSVVFGMLILAASGVPLHDVVIRGLRSATISPVGPYVDAVVWTLVVEVCFYSLICALLFVAGERISRVLPVVAAVLGGASLINLLFEMNGHQLGNLIPILLLLRHGGFFALGILIWAYADGRARPGPILLVILASCVLEIHAVVSQHNAEAGTQFTVLLPVAVWAVGAALVWFGATHTTTTPSRAVRTAGLMTYPIYLIHQTVGGGTIAFAVNRLHWPHGLAFVVGVIVIAAVSWALVVVIEPRLRPGVTRGLDIVVPRRKWLDAFT